MSGSLRDLRLAARTLGRTPGFTVAAVAILAVGIAATTVGFSVLDAFFLRPLPYASPDRLVQLNRTDPRRGADHLRFSLPNVVALRQATDDVFERLAAYSYGARNLASPGQEPERLMVGNLTTDMLELLGSPPARGRGLSPEDGQPGAARVVLLDHGVWQRRFGGADDVVGTTVTLDGVAHAVIGVMPEGFDFPFGGVELWVPVEEDLERFDREYRGFMPVARLRADVDRATALARVNQVYRRLHELDPDSRLEYGVAFEPLRQALLFLDEVLRVVVPVAVVAGGFVLLIVCANLANLLLVRAGARGKEMAIRAALGAGRARLVRPILAESALLSLGGGVLGAVLARLGTGWLAPRLPEDLYRVGTISVDVTALGFVLGLAALSALAFGLVPALRASRPDVAEVLSRSPRGGSAGTASRLRGALVVGQVALALVLLTGSALLVRSFLGMHGRDPGFDADNVLTMEWSLPASEYGDADVVRFLRELRSRLEALPGVTAAATVNPLPLNFEGYARSFHVEGRPDSAEERHQAGLHVVSPGYLETMGIEVLRGRGFADRDDASAAPVVAVNRRLAERHWPDADPVGRRIRMGDGSSERVATVIGVVEDTVTMFKSDELQPVIFASRLQEPGHRNFLVVRTAGPPAAMAGSVRDVLRRLDDDLPVDNVRTMREVVDQSLLPWSGAAATLAVLAIGAMLLAGLGVYGVVAYAASQRARELGIRVALGAQRRDILRLVAREGLVRVGIGLAIGLAASLALTRVLASLLYGIGTADPLSFAAVSVATVALALLASYLPARRATAIDPVEALRRE